MKKFMAIVAFILFFSVLSVGNAAKERAILLTKLPEGNLEYLYLDSIKYSGNNVTYDSKYLFKKPNAELKKNNIAYIINNITLDCSTKEISYNFATNYDSDNKSKGTFSYPLNKTAVEANTVTATKFALLCKK